MNEKLEIAWVEEKKIIYFETLMFIEPLITYNNTKSHYEI